MNILILSHTIYPAQLPRSYRATELAIELARLGHDVNLTAVLGDYDYTAFEKQNGLRVHNFSKMLLVTQRSNGTERRTLLDRILKKTLKKWLEYPDIEFVFSVLNYLRNNKNIDLLITIGMPHPIHWGAALSKKIAGNKFPKIWIADCGDPYMGNKVTQIKPAFYFKYLEKFFCKQTDYITVPVEDAKQGYYPEFWNKIKVIPQGFSFKIADKKNEYKPNTVPTFCYAGVFYRDFRDPTKFLEYLSSLNRPFKFIIFTKTIGLIEPFKDKLKDKLEIYDYVPREELIQKLQKMDFLINFENSTSIQSPSKLIDYGISGRPILSIDGVNPNLENLLQFLNGDYSAKINIGDLQKYNIKNVAQQFLSLAKA